MKLSLLTTLLSMASLSAVAITPDDICWRDGKGIAYQAATGDYSYASLPVKQTGAVEIEKINANTIRVHNFLNIIKYVDFTINGTTIKLKNDGHNSFEAETIDGKTVLLCAGIVNGPYTLPISPVQYPWYENFANQDVEYTGEIIVTNAEDHLFNLYFPNPLFVYDGSFDTSQLFTSVQIATFVPNAAVTDKITDYNGNEKTRSYEIGFVKASDGSFEIPNFANIGVCTLASLENNAYSYSYSLMKGLLSDDITGGRRDFSLSAAPAMLSISSSPYVTWYRSGNVSYWVYSPSSITVYQQKFGKYVNNTDYKGDLTGYVEYTRTPRHNLETTASGWTAADGGSRLTLDGQKAKINAYTIWNDNLGTALGVDNGIIQTVTDTEINFYDDADVTLEATMEINSMSFDTAEGLIINGNCGVVKNDFYLKRLELMMVAGNHTEVTDNEDFSDPVIGHTDAIELGRFNRINGIGEDFSVAIPIEELQKIDPQLDGSYTLFAKAVYNDETGLTPTFHSLTPVAYDFTTGIASVMAESALIEAESGCICISNYVGLVSVFNIQGAKVYEGYSSEIHVALGTYIVKAGKTTKKLIIK